MLDPAIEASIAIRQVMSKGSAKDGRNESWRAKPFHIAKTIRHLMDYQLIKDGHQPPNGEDHVQHLKNAITRLAMQLVMDTSN